MAEKKQNNELDLEKMDQVSGGKLEIRTVVDKQGFFGIGKKTHQEYRAKVGGMTGDWTKDLNQANDQENQFIAKGFN